MDSESPPDFVEGSTDMESDHGYLTPGEKESVVIRSYEVLGSGDETPTAPIPQAAPIGWRRVPGSAFNLINATIGAGILGLPRMVALCGIVLGPLLIVIF